MIRNIFSHYAPATAIPHVVCFQMYDVLVHLPVINVSLSLKGWWETGEGTQETRPIPHNVTGKTSRVGNT